jgi:hypothetical protein
MVRLQEIFHLVWTLWAVGQAVWEEAEPWMGKDP